MKTTKTVSQKASLAFPLQFSKELQEFYKSHNVCPSDDSFSCYQPYRYVRLNPRYDGEQTLHMLQNELAVEAIKSCTVSYKEDLDAGFEVSEKHLAEILNLQFSNPQT